MRQNVIHLEKFYGSKLGHAAQSMVMRRVDTIWPNLDGKEILGFGYASPYIKPYLNHSKRLVLAMPGAQGAIAKHTRRGFNTCLVHDDFLPFADAQFDNIIVAHGLEEAENVPALLNELWRITKPEGRIIVIAPNRGGLWARSEKSPFGSGRPFSKSQLRQFLRTAKYEPVHWSGALYAPPVSFLVKKPMLRLFERFGETVWPGFSGLVLVEAIKRLYAEPSNRDAQRVPRPVFGTAPIGNTAPRR